MGIQSLQDFLDSSPTFSVQLPKFLEESKVKTSNLLLVHADSCIRQFYHEHVDWVCGGQWNELFQSVEKFVRAFRQSDIELVVFFDGSHNDASLHNWSSKHRFYRDIVRETLSHVINNQNIPFRTKTKNFVAPGALKSALRLAFRSFDVMVCCSLDDIYKESLLFGKDQNCLGIIANDANFFLSNVPRYINLGNIRWQKKIFTACKVYNFDCILKDLNLEVKQLPYLAALLGNFMINDASLSSFYWELIEEDHPLKKIQENVVHEAVLPPSEVRLRCVAKFLHEKRHQLENIELLASDVFAKSTNISVEEGTKKLVAVIEYYKDILNASASSVQCLKGEESGLSSAGFPLPSNSAKYKTSWEYVEKTKVVVTPTPLPKPKELSEESGKPPEEVIKQGTLEEAAQALIQLELNEASTVDTQPGEEQEEVKEAHNNDVILENGVIEQDEKPSIPAEDDVAPAKSSASLENGVPLVKLSALPETAPVKCDVDDNTLKYAREIIVAPVSDDISDEVLKVARKRHQSGQMCPEVLNLLTKGEIILDLAVDDEVTTSRLPIPLIFRPLRQLVYGVLFGVKMEKEVEKEVVKEELNVNGILGDDNSSESEVEKNEVDDVNGEVKEADIEEDTEEVTSISIEDVHKHLQEAKDGEPAEEDLLKNKKEEEEHDEMNMITVKEWCIYGDKKLDEPDLVEAKGMGWGVPPLKKLWFGMDSEDNANRLKAFLSCMKSDTVNMSNTAMVPQRMMLLCCVLRYLIQQDSGKAVLTKQDIDAFLAQALSPQLTMEHNTGNLANVKLSHIDARCIQLAAIFMSGIENAIIANDACGSPVPWEFCCPWNFFDGKLFHSKWLMSTMNTSATDLCDGKPHIGEKLERLRWCIVEGLDSKYTITGLSLNKNFFNPFGVPITVNSAPFRGVMRPGGSYLPSQVRSRSRGAGSRRTVHGSGGTLHVAGVPVAHWHGNKAGIGYSKNGPGVLVGGPNSVDLPSSHRRGRGGRGARVNRGRGLLQTPFISPWQQGFGFEEYVNNTYQRYMKGVTKAEQVRAKVGKMNYRYQVYSSRTRNQQSQNNQAKQRGGGSGGGGGNVNTSWFGKGRGQTKQANDGPVKQMTGALEPAYGRGQWINATGE